MIWRRKQERLLAEAALQQSTRQMEVVKRRQPEVTSLTRTLRTAGETNHFIERLNMHVRRGNQ